MTHMTRTINCLEKITARGINDIESRYDALKPLYSEKRYVSWISEWMCLLSFLSLNNELQKIESLLDYSLSITYARPPEPDFSIVNSKSIESNIEITKIATEPMEMLLSESQICSAEFYYLDIPPDAYTKKGIPKNDVMSWRKKGNGKVGVRDDDEMPNIHDSWVKKCFESVNSKTKPGKYSKAVDILILDDRYWAGYALQYRKSRFSRLADTRILETIPNVNIPTIIAASDQCLGIIRFNNNWLYELMSKT